MALYNPCIDIFSVSDPQDEDDESFGFYTIDDAIISDPVSPQSFVDAFQWFAYVRVFCE